MSYMTISSQEKNNISLCSCFHAHPTTLLLKILENIWGDQCMGSPPTSNLRWGDRPPPRSPPLVIQLVVFTLPLVILNRTISFLNNFHNCINCSLILDKQKHC